MFFFLTVTPQRYLEPFLETTGAELNLVKYGFLRCVVETRFLYPVIIFL